MRSLAIAIAIAILALSAGVPARAAECDRACLTGFVDRYLDALAAHDPARLPHAANVRFTENNVPLDLGKALWATISEVGAREITLADPVTGEAGVLAVVREGDRPTLLAARLKVADRQVAELETVVARKETSSFMDPAGWIPSKPSLAEDVLPAARRPRAALIALADAYFSAVVDPDAPPPPFDDSCNRIENGVQTTHSAKDTAPGSLSLNKTASGLGCADQFKSKALKFVSRVRDRRYVLVDEQKGLVLSEVMFDHDGVSRPASGGAALVAPLPSPYSFMVAELFKIRDGRILEIQAAITQVPYGMPAAWP